MDPAPIVDLAHALRAADIVPQPQALLPFAVAVPPVAATLGRRLHVLATALNERTAQHLALDAAGPLQRQPTLVELHSAATLTSCDDTLVAIGSTDGDTRRVAVAFDPQGTVRWRRELPIAGEPVRALQALCVGGRIELLWLTGAERTTLWWAALTIADQAPTPVLRDGLIPELTAAPGGDGLTVALQRAGNAELLRVVAGRIAARATLPNTAGLRQPPSVAVVGDQHAVSWLGADGVLRLQWLDWQLVPLGAAQSLVAADEGPVSASELVSGAPLLLAVIWQRLGPGRGWTVRPSAGVPQHARPVRHEQGFVAAYDVRSRTLGPPHAIGAGAATAAWAGDVLLVVHGDQVITISPFALRPPVQK